VRLIWRFEGKGGEEYYQEKDTAQADFLRSVMRGKKKAILLPFHCTG
jgi:hypothetical protein